MQTISEAKPSIEGHWLALREFTKEERLQIALWFLRGHQAMQRAALRELSIKQENTTP